MTYADDDPEVAEHRAEVAAIDAAMREAAQDAIQLHIRLGLPLVEWHDGKVVLVPPSQLQVDAAPLRA